ncbi:MAG: hypothetical protein ACKV0T_12145 [Planctomycetales bacterium]
MNADQLAEIRPALREVVEGAPDTCVTFEVAGDPNRWIQVVDRTVNAAYPHADHPEERISRLELPPVSAMLVSWEAHKFATFEFAQIDLKAVAEWIDAYFVRVIGCTDGEYHLDVAFFRV